jgi:hypothetical protein
LRLGVHIIHKKAWRGRDLSLVFEICKLSK